jgi:hypothetical protein
MAFSLLLRHSRNTSRDVYRARVRHPVCVIIVTCHVMFTVPPYCLRRHTLLLHGRLATVVNKRHIAYSMHVILPTACTSHYDHGSEGGRNQKRLCWRGPAAIYLTELDITSHQLLITETETVSETSDN